MNVVPIALGRYLTDREEYGDAPGFYVDCARYFLTHDETALGFRVLSNLLELRSDSPRFIRVAANLNLEYGRFDAAVELFETLTELRPENPQAFLDLAVALTMRAQESGSDDLGAAKHDLEKAAELFRQVAFEPWGPIPDDLVWVYLDSDRFPNLGLVALTELNAVVQTYRRLFDGMPPQLEDLDPIFIRPVEADLRIVLTWDDEFSDIDLWVTEPSGEDIYYENMGHLRGGYLAEDFTDGLGPEVYTISDAPAGRYDIVVDYFGDAGPSLVGPVTVRARITTNFGRENERTVIRTTRLNEVDEKFDVGSVAIDGGAE